MMAIPTQFSELGRRTESAKGSSDALCVIAAAVVKPDRAAYTPQVSVSPATTAAFLRAREADRQKQLAARRSLLLAKLPGAAALLRERFSANEVFLFGSLATGSNHEQSDVDLAVRGLESKYYWSALADLADHFECDVDLVRLETAVPTLVHRVVTTGILL